MYALTSDAEGKLFLEVVHGGMAMENLVLPLSSDEEALYKASGKPALDDLAKKVLRNREGFSERFLR